MKLAKFVGVGLIGAAALLGVVGAAPSSHSTPAPAPLASADGAYKVDSVHSSAIFRVRHNDVSYFYGRFNKIEGSFAIGTDAAKNSTEITIAADSVDTGNAKRDGHLKSQDFFSATEFPTITFKSKSWKATGSADGESSFDVTGDLTMRGVTKEVTVPVRHTGSASGKNGGELAGLEAKFTIKRSDFGVKYGLPKALGDDVTIMVGLEGGRQ